jgi:hypothetical protein
LKFGRRVKVLTLSGVVLVSAVMVIFAFSRMQPNPVCGVTGCANTVMAMEATLTIFHHSAQLDRNLVGWVATGCGQTVTVPSSWSFAALKYDLLGAPACAAGWTYVVDPTVTITNQGYDFIQMELYGVIGTPGCTNNCAANADIANILGASTATLSVAATDCYATGNGGCTTQAGACDTANVITSAYGFADKLATTLTPGTPGSPEVSVMSATFTAVTNPTSAVDRACILTHLTGSGNPYIFGEVAFGPDSFAVGDQLVETFSMTST